MSEFEPENSIIVASNQNVSLPLSFQAWVLEICWRLLLRSTCPPNLVSIDETGVHFILSNFPGIFLMEFALKMAASNPKGLTSSTIFATFSWDLSVCSVTCKPKLVSIGVIFFFFPPPTFQEWDLGGVVLAWKKFKRVILIVRRWTIARRPNNKMARVGAWIGAATR